MLVLIVSDTHGRDDNFLSVIKKEKNIGLIVHLGDIGRLADKIEDLTGIPTYMVRGNNDYGSPLPGESVIMLGRHRTFITHGHDYGVTYSESGIIRTGRILECDYILYGHTHFPEVNKHGDITIVNPGSLTYPRQPGHEPSYVIATIDESGDATFQIKYLKD